MNLALEKKLGVIFHAFALFSYLLKQLSDLLDFFFFSK